jgi:fucose permease
MLLKFAVQYIDIDLVEYANVKVLCFEALYLAVLISRVLVERLSYQNAVHIRCNL